MSEKGNAVYVQWLDSKVVTMISSIHCATDFVWCTRHAKQNGQHVEVHMKQPMVIHDYNHGMGGIDVFDQRAAAFRIQCRALKYYKSIVFDFIDVIILNSHTLFNDYCSTQPGEIPRPSKYSQKDFRVALVCQLAGIGEDESVPQFKPLGRPVNPLPPITHLPEAMPIRRNCRYCFRIDHVERKCQVRCPTCNVFLHVERRNCFMLYHLNML